ncbi:PP_RS20740 family protein [Burkholderia metallica]|uniref:PP_RS20740 family protein n=1 Tax=Burkholderia metallica TaxID=488729 RepID=UPI001CF4746A|nr:hypothetical protein [Burkholderia metallica]MCA8003169.1 hypothetical protein [Burkholderia metallica]
MSQEERRPESGENDMVNNESAAEVELADFLPQRPTGPIDLKRKFRPWHKPRKQYIRRMQWWSEIDALLNDTAMPPDNRVLRYLTLPSEDMIDVRVLTEELGRRGVKLKYLGYCDVKAGSEDDQRMNLADAAVRESVTVEGSSIIVRERLEDTANEATLAFRALHEHGPFHAVNVDLCQNLAKPRIEDMYACVDAIGSIVRVQIERMQKSWVLFVTTRVTPNHIDAAHLQAFVNAILDNIGRSPEFSAQSSAMFAAQGLELTAKLAKASELSFDEFKSLFCMGLGKWLLMYVSNSTPRLKVEMLPSYYYSVYAGNPDMLSLAYRCTLVSQVPTDPSGLIVGAGLPPANQGGHEDEVCLGLKILERTRELTNLDAYLASRPDEMAEMVKESARYLALAGYNVEEYPAFAVKSETAAVA